MSDYRVGLAVQEDAVTFVRVLHRREFYRYFPWPHHMQPVALAHASEAIQLWIDTAREFGDPRFRNRRANVSCWRRSSSHAGPGGRAMTSRTFADTKKRCLRRPRHPQGASPSPTSCLPRCCDKLVVIPDEAGFREADFSGVGSRTGKNWGVRRGLSGISGHRRYSLAPKEGKQFGEVLCP